MDESESHASETLFSFEVLVDYIRIHKAGIVKRGFEPAVGVRLLDFPTLVIYRGEQEDCRHQEDSDSEKENAGTRISKHDVLLQQTMNRNMEYPFRKGKSCLFKINLDLLHTHLSNVPLYVMVLDSTNEIPKLLGSSMVSLAKIIDVIKSDVKQLGICTPSAQGEKGLFGIYNLMGEKIGCISLGYKLLSLGASLIPHIPESRVLHLGSGKTTVNNKQPLKPSDNFPETRTHMGDDILVTSVQRSDPSNVLCQNIELDGQQTDIVVSEMEAKRTNGVSAGTQTEPARRKVKSIEVEQMDFDNEGNLAVYCPPPLFYSRSDGRREESDVDRYRLVNVAMEALRVEDLRAEEEERDLPAERRRSVAPPEGAQRSRAAGQSQAPPALLGEALRRLPLLSALLQELSQLSGQPQELPVPAPPGLAWQGRPAPAHPPRPQPRSSCTSPQPWGSRSPSPWLRRSQTQVNSAAPLLAPPPKDLRRAQRQGLGPGKEAPKSPPKRKLVHGLTRTVQLRLQQHNPGALREQERREQLWRSRAAIPKPSSRSRHRTGAAKPAHKLTVSPRDQAQGRSVDLDENVQTLVSSVDVDSARTGTPPLQTGESRRGGERRRTGKSENGGAVPPMFSYDRVSEAAAERAPALPGRNRTVRVRIPSALSQYSDRSDGGAGDPWPVPTDPGFRSGSAGSSRRSSPVTLRSDSRVGSPDLGEYLDDFTSLEPTDGFSPDLPDSPEPAAGADGASRGSRRPALSSPVKSRGSPQRRLKGTHIIRPRTRASALSISSGDSERASASACSLPSGRRWSGAAGGAARGPSVCEESGGSGAQLSVRFENSPSVRASPADSHSLSNSPELDSIISPPPDREGETRDELGSLGFSNKCHHISELVLSKLPGYTL